VGAGTIRANRAIVPLLTFDVPAADYYSSAGDELGRIDLNIPSINAPLMPGQISTTRWGKNVSGTTQTFSASADAPSGAIIKVTSPGWTVSAGHTLRLRITIKAPDLPEGQYFGSITLTNAKGKTVFIPVAFFRTQGAVRLAHSCAPTTIAVDAMTDCEVAVENNDASPANVELDVTTSDVAELRIRNVSAPGVGSGDAFSFDGTLAPAVAPPIESIDPGGSPGPGYLPLAGFGVPPLAGFGDETIATLGVPSFLYGSETYDAVAITSNGYAVVGGGEAADLNYIPQSLPDPARPNNVVAPFWTDLNPSVGGNLYAAELTDGVNAWIVLEWEAVPVYSTGDPVTMQIWIQEGTTESVTWAYGDIPAAGDPAGLTVGAENRDGTSGQMLGSVPADDSDYTVVAGAPTPGGTVVITYRAKALVAGNATLTARLRSPVMPGVSIQRVHIHMI